MISAAHTTALSAKVRPTDADNKGLPCIYGLLSMEEAEFLPYMCANVPNIISKTLER